MWTRFAITPGLAVATTFAAYGSGFGAWAGAAPAIMAKAGLDKEQWGLGILAFTAAGVIAMYAMSRLAAIGFVALLAGFPRVVPPWVFGVVAERASLDAAFGLAAMTMLGGLVPAALLPRRGRRSA